MEIERPLPPKDYPSDEEMYIDYDKFQKEIRDALGLTAEQHHQLGPAEIERRLSLLGHTIVENSEKY